MAQWDRFYLDRILDLGDDLYVKSITRSGTTECDPSVPPQKVHNSIYLGRRKVSIAIDDNLKVTAKIVIVAEQKVKEAFQDALTKFFQMTPTGIFTILGKSFAFWIQDNAYYLFDPADHNELGELWKGLPGTSIQVISLGKGQTVIVDKGRYGGFKKPWMIQGVQLTPLIS